MLCGLWNLKFFSSVKNGSLCTHVVDVCWYAKRNANLKAKRLPCKKMIVNDDDVGQIPMKELTSTFLLDFEIGIVFKKKFLFLLPSLIRWVYLFSNRPWSWSFPSLISGEDGLSMRVVNNAFHFDLTRHLYFYFFVWYCSSNGCWIKSWAIFPNQVDQATRFPNTSVRRFWVSHSSIWIIIYGPVSRSACLYFVFSVAVHFHLLRADSAHFLQLKTRFDL